MTSNFDLDVQATLDALAIIKTARVQAIDTEPRLAWVFLYDASKHLNESLEAYFRPPKTLQWVDVNNPANHGEVRHA